MHGKREGEEGPADTFDSMTDYTMTQHDDYLVASSNSFDGLDVFTERDALNVYSIW